MNFVIVVTYLVAWVPLLVPLLMKSASLIPKIDGMTQMKDLKPISLILT